MEALLIEGSINNIILFNDGGCIHRACADIL